MSGKRKPLSRRQFIKETAAAAAATTFLAPLKDQLFAQPRNPRDFDYVIIGSGAGGGPVAVNLVKEGFRVALIEAGSRETTVESQVPSYHGLSTEVPSLTWSFGVRHYESDTRTKNEIKYRENLDGILYPRGSTIGGSTAVNAMITMYPDNSDWDYLESITNDPSWNSTEMRQHFQRLENCRYRHRGLLNKGRHGFGGWLSTEQANVEFLFRDPQIKKIVLGALEAEGFGDMVRLLKKVGSLDPNDWRRVEKRLEGFFNTPTATFQGKRHGVRQLIPDTERQFPDRLQIFHESLVRKIEFHNPSGGPLRAKAVHFLKGRSLYKADTRSNQFTRLSAVADYLNVGREVIVAGGTFNSPQILMLSGIGPRETLRKHGIQELKHLPGVGQNLQDRYEIGVVSQAKEDFELVQACTLNPSSDPCYNEYVMDPENHIYSTNGVVLGLIKKSSESKMDPDLYVFGLPGRFTGYYPGWVKNAFQKNQFTWAVLKGHTYNKAGFVTLRSADPMDTPIINFRYFEEGSDAAGGDLRAMVQGIKIAREINRKGAAVVREELVPGPQHQTDEELREYLRRNAWGHHASGTNKMGYDEMSVVDKDFKVHGTSNVRVVDASVFPKIPGLFIVAPVYMIAEKASHVIRAAATHRSRF